VSGCKIAKAYPLGKLISGKLSCAVFNGVTPMVNRALLLAHEEANFWMLAGAKGLSGVVATGLPEQ
jgi:hypothetical protein